MERSMFWETDGANPRKSILTCDCKDGSRDTLAEVERLPSGAWRWDVFEAADYNKARGVEPTHGHAQTAAESVIVPDRDPYDTIPWKGAAQPSSSGLSFVPTGEVSDRFNWQDLRPLFATRTIDPGTKIVGEHYTMIDDIPVLRERWKWERVTASSFVIHKQNVPGLDEADILSLLRRQIAVPDEYTFTNHADSQFVFVNYDFLVLD